MEDDVEEMDNEVLKNRGQGVENSEFGEKKDWNDEVKGGSIEKGGD